MTNLDALLDETIKGALSQLKVDRKELAESRLMLLSAMVYHLINEKKIEYDLIVGGGNTGRVCVEITRFICQYLGLACPPAVTIPVVRYKNEQRERFDNSGLIPYVKSQISGLNQLKRILFVDDEIRIGFTAKTCFELIGKAINQNFTINPVTADIVAENHLFAWQHDLQGVSVRFFPHALVFFGYNNNLSFLPASELKQKVRDILGREVNINQLLATLLTGAIKVNTENEAHWDNSLENELSKKLENYQDIKTDFRNYVSNLVSRGIESFKKGEIKLRLYV